MVCIYCGGSTAVINSRHQKRANQVWRRRQCEQCSAVFSTQEALLLSKALVVRKNNTNHLEPFSRDKLFLSIYESCKHRSTAIDDATAIALDITGRLSGITDTGVIQQTDLIRITTEVLGNFDRTALAVYKGLHSLRSV
jgi:transcriptional regulator NrdR family protein